MEYVNIALRLFTVSQLFLLAFMILSASGNSYRVRFVVAMLTLSVFSFLAMPIVDNYLDLPELHFLWFFANIAPSLLLLFVWFIFEEKCSLPIWLIAVVSFGVFSSLWFRVQGIGLPDAPFWVQLSKVLISIGTILVMWVGRYNDLVETRFKVRNIMIFSLCLMLISIILIDIVAGFDRLIYLDFIELLVLFVFSLLCNIYFIRLNPKFQLSHEEPLIQEESDDDIVAELLARMQSERLYTNHDLRLASLAELLNIPEYKLRKKINQQLGYRNFNQFVNHYRIDEASKKLLQDKRTPVLSIALDVGFRSISSFNSAFQAQFGMSPTKYRNQKV